MRTALIVVALLAVAALASDYQSQWESFKATHHKKYASPVEEARRFAIFRNHVDFITKHNEEFAAGLHTYTTAINEYCDLSTEEFVAQVNGYRRNPEKIRREKVLDVALDTLPSTVDWRTKGVVTGVKNQGQCGSCWSFSATGSTEGQHALTTGTLVSLSEQNLVDCSTAEGNEGCEGGLMDQAFEYIIKNNGIDTEASYPYTATGPNKCKYNPANKGATLVSYHDIPSENEDALQVAVATIGPVSVAIDASHQSFQVYSSGVYYEPACSETQLDHGVLAIGYGVDGGKQYWLVKNSWGTSWGMAGYIEMSRNRSNNCGIATDASYPIASSSTSTATATTGATSAATNGPSSGPYAAASNSAGTYSSGGSSGAGTYSSGGSSGGSYSSGGSSGGSYSSGGYSSGGYSSGGYSSGGSSGNGAASSGIYFSSGSGSSGGYSSGGYSSGGYSSGGYSSGGYSSGGSSGGYSSGGSGYSSGSGGQYSSGNSGYSGSGAGYSSGGSGGAGSSAAGYSSGFTGFPHSSATGQSTQ